MEDRRRKLPSLESVLVSVLQRNRINRMHIYTEIYFKELGYTIVRAGKFKHLQGSLETQGRFKVVT